MRGRALVLWALAAVLAVAAWLLPPIPQPHSYHQFADQSVCFGISHCLDTLSNLPFILAGLAGLAFLAGRSGREVFAERREMLPYVLFFLAAVAVGFASGYYHLAPDNGRLVWDRAAIAVALMSWFAAIIGERVGISWGLRLLPWLLAAGLGSVAWWGWSEAAGHGDLRFYGLMQILPMALVPLLLRLYPPRYSGDRHILAVLAFYLLALACDFLDRPIADLTGSVGGHTIKHLLAAGAAYWVVVVLKKRRMLLPT